MRLGLEDSRDELFLRNLIYRAIKYIGEAPTDIKTECIEVCDLSIKKPCDFISGKDMNLLNESGEVCYYQFSPNGFLHSEESRTRNGYRNIKVGEDDHCFHLSSLANEARVTTAELQYYAFMTDDNGDPLIREVYFEAVQSYILWNYLTRERNINRGTSKFPHSEVQDAKMAFHREVGRVKGEKNLPSPQQAEVMLRKWVTGIPNFQNKIRNSRFNRISGRYR